MLRTAILTVTLAVLSLPLRADDARAPGAKPHRATREPPGIRLWTSHGEVYHRGEPVRIYFRTERDAYVTIFRVDTDGRVRVLFPRLPTENNYVQGGSTYDVPNYGRHDAFIVDDDPGAGYVYGVAAADPFLYDPMTANDHWDVSLVGDGRIHGDPYTSLAELVQRILPPDYRDYDTHLLPYYVEQHYDYPRFVCYDCHTYVGYSYWNPYRYYCPRFSLFVYYDPYYFYPSYWYPTRYYGGTRVVYVQPGRVYGRYLFKPRQDQTQPAIVYRDRRRDGFASAPERGVRGADIGGVGSVGVPGMPGRRTLGGEAGAAGSRVPGGAPVERAPAERVPVMGGEAGRRTLVPEASNPGGGRAPGGAPAERAPASPGAPGAPTSPGAPQDEGGRRRTVNAPAPSAGQAAPPRREYLQPIEGDRRGISTYPYPQGRPMKGGAQERPEARPAPESRPEPARAYVRPPESRPEPRPEPRAEPRPQSRPEPRAAPRPESRPEPRAAPAPRPESRPAPPPPSGGGTMVRRRP